MKSKRLRILSNTSERQIIGIALILCLASCVTPEQLAEKDAAVCTKSGYTKGTQTFLDCMGKTAGDRERRNAEIGQAVSAGLQSYGASSQSNYNNYQATRPRQTSCYSSGYGYGVTTNCTTY